MHIHIMRQRFADLNFNIWLWYFTPVVSVKDQYKPVAPVITSVAQDQEIARIPYLPTSRTPFTSSTYLLYAFHFADLKFLKKDARISD